MLNEYIAHGRYQPTTPGSRNIYSPYGACGGAAAVPGRGPWRALVRTSLPRWPVKAHITQASHQSTFLRQVAGEELPTTTPQKHCHHKQQSLPTESQGTLTWQSLGCPQQHSGWAPTGPTGRPTELPQQTLQLPLTWQNEESTDVSSA